MTPNAINDLGTRVNPEFCPTRQDMSENFSIVRPNPGQFALHKDLFLLVHDIVVDHTGKLDLIRLYAEINLGDGDISWQLVANHGGELGQGQGIVPGWLAGSAEKESKALGSHVRQDLPIAPMRQTEHPQIIPCLSQLRLPPHQPISVRCRTGWFSPSSQCAVPQPPRGSDRFGTRPCHPCPYWGVTGTLLNEL